MSPMDKSSSVPNSFGAVARKCDNHFCRDHFRGSSALPIDDEGDSVFFFSNFETVFAAVDASPSGPTRPNRGSDAANSFSSFAISP